MLMEPRGVLSGGGGDYGADPFPERPFGQVKVQEGGSPAGPIGRRADGGGSGGKRSETQKRETDHQYHAAAGSGYGTRSKRQGIRA